MGYFTGFYPYTMLAKLGIEINFLAFLESFLKKIMSVFAVPNGSFVTLYAMFLRLTNSSLFIWVRINHFEARLMVLSQKADAKVLWVAIKLNYFDEEKAKWRLQCLKF